MQVPKRPSRAYSTMSMRRLADTGEQPVDDLLQRGRTARIGWLVLGLILVGVGLVGIFVPLLPTTDFMILALPCFARSSPRLEAWLLNHPRFGAGLRAWRLERAVPRRAKIAACMGMALGYGLFFLTMRPGVPLAVGIALALILSAAWLISRPSPDKRA